MRHRAKQLGPVVVNASTLSLRMGANHHLEHFTASNPSQHEGKLHTPRPKAGPPVQQEDKADSQQQGCKNRASLAWPYPGQLTHLA